ncbi:MAG: type II and III secretion system protein family protein [Armatimonadota bacterium]
MIQLRANPIVALFILSLASWPVVRASAAENMAIAVGSYRTITGSGIKQVAISDPTLLDVQPISTSELLVTGLSPGTTQLFVWDIRGRHQYQVTVVVDKPNIEIFANLVQAVMPTPEVTAEAVGDKVILHGQVESEGEKRRVETMAKALYPKVESLLTVRPGASLSAVAAMNETLSSLCATAHLMPDGKVLIQGCVKDAGALKLVKDGLQPWAKEAEFVYQVAMAKSPEQEAVEGLSSMLSKWQITVTQIPDGPIAIEGAVPSKEVLAEVQSVIDSWTKGMAVVTRISADDAAVAPQVLIRARVIELNRTDTLDLGVDWGKIVYTQSSGSGTSFGAADQPFVIGQPRPGPFPLFGGPPIEQLDAIGARVNALIHEDKARLLAQPSLVTISGKPANILIGGEIPIPVPQSGVGSAAVITIQYKEFGIKLFVLPTVGDNGEIVMLVRPEVSSLDFADGIEINGIRVPAFRTRRAETVVRVLSGTSIAIGGLISEEDIKNIKRIPLLSKIPVLGNFFKNVSTKKTNSELLILVTPEIVEHADASNVLKDQGPTIPRPDPTCPIPNGIPPAIPVPTNPMPCK